MLLSQNVVESECCCVGMPLCRNVVVAECCCVGMVLCRNGNMSGYVLSGYVFYGDKKTDDHEKCDMVRPCARSVIWYNPRARSVVW